AGFEVLLYRPACRAIAEDTAQRACDEMRDAGVILCADLERLDSALTGADKEK
ncbi:nicotinamidase, partial [Pseudomonas aeruginosa]